MRATAKRAFALREDPSNAAALLFSLIVLHTCGGIAQSAGGSPAKTNREQDIPVPVVTSDSYYGFAGPAFKAQFRAPGRPVRGQVFRSDYQVDNEGLEIVNGPNLFNRPLYSPGCRAFLTVGDRPAFVYWSNNEIAIPDESGWGRPHGFGYSFVGIALGGKSKWLHDFDYCRTVFHPGWVEYALWDALFPKLDFHIEVVPVEEGAFLIRARVSGGTKPAKGIELVWSHGCLNFEGDSCWKDSYDIQSRDIPWDQPEVARNDQVEFREGIALLQDERDRSVWVAAGSSPPPTREFVADAANRMSNAPEALFERPAKGAPVAVTRIQPTRQGGVLQATLAVQWTWKQDPFERAKALLRDPDGALSAGKAYFRQRCERIMIRTPDPNLDRAFSFAAVASDSMWHPPGINHGAYSWGGLTTIFRTFYGLTCSGDHDRVASALRFHCGVDAAGQLRNLATSPLNQPTVSSYHSYGSTVDMLWHHYLWSGDRETLHQWAPVVDRMLEFQEKHRKDARGLFIDHLGFWCSDSFDYQEGCAVGTTFTWRMYQLRGRIAEVLGENPEPYVRRAVEIRSLMNSILWCEDGGFFYDLIPADGEPLPAAIAPAIYHPIEYGMVEGHQAERMMDWMLSRLTSRQGMVRVDDWFPINWSHNVYSPLETANAAIAGFRLRRAEKAYGMLQGIARGTMRGAVVPGSISCMSSSTGYTRNGTDFGDGVSLFLRGTVEGLFGIEKNAPQNLFHVFPNFPASWDQAELIIPDIQLSYRRHAVRKRSNTSYQIELPQKSSLKFSLPVSGAVRDVTVNSRAIPYHVEQAERGRFLLFQTDPDTRFHVEVQSGPPSISPSKPASAPAQTQAETNELYGWPNRITGCLFETADLSRLSQLPFADIYKLYPGELTWQMIHDKEPRTCRPCAHVSGSNTRLVVAGVPFNVGATQIVAIRKSGEGIWKGIDNIEVPDAVTIPINSMAEEVFLLGSGLCSPMTCHLPQLRVELKYEGGQTIVRELRSPYELDFISQHTAEHPAVAMGWFGKQKDLAAWQAKDLVNSPGELLHADVIHLAGNRGILEQITIRALKRHSGLILYGVTTGRRN